MHKKHFIIVEVSTETEQTPKAAEDMVLAHLRTSIAPEQFKFVSVGWIADNVRNAPTGTQYI